jgi:hypothetical protein
MAKEIIDILTITKARMPFFTVNTALEYVTMQWPNPLLAFDYLINASAKNIFPAGDSFSILSAGLILPESFTIFKDPAIATYQLISFRISLEGISTDEYKIDIFGGANPNIFIPMENFELSLDMFLDVTKQANLTPPPGHLPFLTENFKIWFTINSLQISMKNIPAAYNTKSYYISPFFKILHNYPLI